MKLVLLFLFATFIIASANNVIQTIPNSAHKDHPGKCYLPTTPPTILSPGDTTTLAGVCKKVICDRYLKVEIHSCTEVKEKDGCKKVDESANKPYPQCCPRIKC